MSDETRDTSGGGLMGNVASYFKNFEVLRHTRSEYWGIQIINFLDSTTFFSILTIAVVMLSDDFGFSDVKAGYVVTLYASTTTICLFFSGMITDWLGIRRAFLVAMTGQFITRAVIMLLAIFPTLLPDHRGTLVTVAFFLMAPFVAMIQTVYQAANKRFTTRKSRGAGFNMWYLFMNVGAAAGGFLIDIVRLSLGLPNGHIFTFAILAHILCFFLVFTLVRREEQIYDEDEEPTVDTEEKKVRKKPWEIAAAVIRESVFWRFVVLISLLIGVRAVFLYLHLLWPKYWLRVIGADAKIGVLQAINPILVIVGLIVLIPILHKYNVYKMLTFGGIISGLCLFVLAIPSYGHMTYVYSIIALIVLTVGEVIWSPRLNEYTAAIAPEGQEGTYLGLSMVPYFFAKTVVSLLSGHMLARWVPEDMGERLRAGTVAFVDSPSMLWLILGVFALGGPLVALLMKNWFTKGAQWDRAKH